jgi:hypothetical protein
MGHIYSVSYQLSVISISYQFLKVRDSTASMLALDSSEVAQVANLLYRRLPIGRVCD